MRIACCESVKMCGMGLCNSGKGVLVSTVRVCAMQM